MGNRPRVIRCPVHGSIPFSDHEMTLVGSRYLQRLRSITQLGFASLVFPGATHTRFAHSLGACHLAGKMFDQLLLGGVNRLQDFYPSDRLSYFRRILRLAALLHDVGHPPFSHAAERVLPPVSRLAMPPWLVPAEDRRATHEDFTYAIIWDMAQAGLLNQEEAEDIIALLNPEAAATPRFEAAGGVPLIHPLLRQLINGEIDVDRMDYLLRDSLFAGVPYGRFDQDRLIGSLSPCLHEGVGRLLLALDGEDLATYENFLLSRVHMFYQIYFHKTLGAFTHYINQVFEQKEIDLHLDGSMENYLSLDENGLKDEISRAQGKPWSAKIAQRIPAKTLFRVKDSDPERLVRLNQAAAALKNAGVEHFAVHSHNRYSSQIRGQKPSSTSIMVVEKELGKHRLIPLASQSKLLDAREKQIEVHQLYVPREAFAQALELLQEAP